MNCIGHRFSNNSDTLFRMRLLINEVKLSKTSTPQEDIKLYKFTFSYKLKTISNSNFIDDLKKIVWVEEVNNKEATLYFDNKVSIKERIMRFKLKLLKHNLMMSDIKLKQVFYSDYDYNSFEFSMPPTIWWKITYNDIRELIIKNRIST